MKNIEVYVKVLTFMFFPSSASTAVPQAAFAASVVLMPRYVRFYSFFSSGVLVFYICDLKKKKHANIKVA